MAQMLVTMKYIVLNIFSIILTTDAKIHYYTLSVYLYNLVHIVISNLCKYFIKNIDLTFVRCNKDIFLCSILFT